MRGYLLARLNFEDDLFSDIRFMKLAMKLDDVDRALGCLVRAWRIAQKWYLKSPQGVPVEEWDKQFLPPEILECGLAKRRGDFVWVMGSDEQFSWLKQRQKAGQNSGKVRSKKALTVVERSLTGDQRLGTSYSYSSSSLSYDKEEAVVAASTADNSHPPYEPIPEIKNIGGSALEVMRHVTPRGQRALVEQFGVDRIARLAVPAFEWWESKGKQGPYSRTLNNYLANDVTYEQKKTRGVGELLNGGKPIDPFA